MQRRRLLFQLPHRSQHHMLHFFLHPLQRLLRRLQSRHRPSP